MNPFDFIIHSNDVEKIITKGFQNDAKHNIANSQQRLQKLHQLKGNTSLEFHVHDIFGDGKMQKGSQRKRRNMFGHYFTYTSCILLIQPHWIFEKQQE